MAVGADGSIAVGGSSGGDLAVARCAPTGRPRRRSPGRYPDHRPRRHRQRRRGGVRRQRGPAGGSGGASRLRRSPAIRPRASSTPVLRRRPHLGARAGVPRRLGDGPASRRRDRDRRQLRPSNGPTDVALARFRLDGEPDPAFGSGGARVLDLVAASPTNGRRRRATPDGGLALSLDPASTRCHARLDGSGASILRSPRRCRAHRRGGTDGTTAVAVQATAGSSARESGELPRPL